MWDPLYDPSTYKQNQQLQLDEMAREMEIAAEEVKQIERQNYHVPVDSDALFEDVFKHLDRSIFVMGQTGMPSYYSPEGPLYKSTMGAEQMEDK